MNVVTPKALQTLVKLHEALADFRLPTQADLTKLALVTLVDQYGFMKAVRAITKTLDEAIKKNLLERLPVGPTEGRLFRVTKSEYERSSFNEDFCREELIKFMRKKKVAFTVQELNTLINRFYRITDVTSLRCSSRQGD